MTVADLAARNEAARLYEAYADAEVALCEAEQAEADEATTVALVAKVDAAIEAYQAAGLELMMGGEGIERCAITGVPLLLSDDVVIVLRSALEPITARIAEATLDALDKWRAER